MKLPDFVIIGAAKSGTTTIYRHFSEDNAFFLSRRKEPGFFARDEVFLKGANWYSQLFVGAQQGQLCGEASTIYTLSPLFPKSAERMHSVIPDAKLIYIMRDPVKRAYSYYVQLIKNFQNSNHTSEIPKTFEEMLFCEEGEHQKCSPFLASYDSHLPFSPLLLTSGGMYIDQLSVYLKFYDIGSIYCMIFEDFVADPLTELNKLYDFLGVDASYLQSNFVNHRENISNDHFRHRFAYEMIEELRSLPLVRVISKAASKGFKNTIIKLLASEGFQSVVKVNNKPDSMSPKTEKYLKELYYEPTSRLAELLGRDFLKYWSLEN